MKFALSNVLRLAWIVVIAICTATLGLSSFVAGVRVRDHGTLPLPVLAAIIVITLLLPVTYQISAVAALGLSPLLWRLDRRRIIVLAVILVIVCGVAYGAGLRSTGINDGLAYPMV